MKRAYLAVFCLLTASLGGAQSTTPRSLHFDLSSIGMVLDGEQICNDTNPRLQETPSKMMDRIIAGGAESVPLLIRMLADTRMAPTKEPIICYWPGMTISDIAFCLLTGLFTDTHGKTTVPGAGWSDMLGPDDKTAWVQLHTFIKKHGTAGLQARWWRVGNKYGRQISWDAKEECFKLKARQ